MTDYASPQPVAARPGRARNWLSLSAKTWFAVTAIGQWFFVVYILGFYVPRVSANGPKGLEGTHLPKGYIEGDTIGNIAIVMHILVAAFIIAAGQLQLIPAIRQRMPKLHRWSGRFYMGASVLVVLAGLYLSWAREAAIGTNLQSLGTSTGGVLVLIFVPLALYAAIKRDFAAHRRWALRLFMVVSAVWYFRLIIFGWLMTTGGAFMDTKTFTGPFLLVASYAQFALPLLVLQLYFWAEKPKNKAHKTWVAGVIFACTGMMAIGVFAVTMGFWIPRVFT